MNKFILLSVMALLAGQLTAQTAKFGKFNPDEISYSEVPFEPDASAALLVHDGWSKFNGNIFETTYFFRVKILKETGKEYGDIRVRYYAGDQRVEALDGVKAEITSFENGQPITEKVGKDNIFDVELSDGYREMRITFPNVQVGSILEYSYRKADKNIDFLDAWTFQNNIPTLYSHYSINMPPSLKYRTMGQGENFVNKVERTESYGIHSFTLRDLHAFKEEPYMKNYRDYLERVEFQLSQYSNGSQWIDTINSWEKLGDGLIEYYRNKGYYRSGKIEREFLEVDLEGVTQRETAQKGYYYLRDNFTIEGDDWIYPSQNLPQLFKSKTGTPAEMILALMGLLKSTGIQVEPVMIGSKGYGRTHLVPYPFLSQFDEILLLANLDGEEVFIDLNDKMAPFGYVDLDKQVAGGLYLEQDKSRLIPIELKHSSNSIIFSEVRYAPDSGLMIKNTFREYQYKGLRAAHVIDSFEKSKKPLSELFASETETFEIKNLESSNQLHEKNFFSLNFDMEFPETKNLDLIAFNPIKFSSYDKNPFTAAYRVFPVDFDFPFSETSISNILIPEGYEVDDFPLAEKITIPGGHVVFSYTPTVSGNALKITTKFEVRNPLVPQENYANLKFFMESVASKLQAPVVLKKISKP